MNKVNCTYCGNKTDLPFECNYCKDEFCSEHRLPEEHRCVKLSSIRAKKFGEKKVIRQKKGFFSKLFGR
ncbi:MAG: AN1-type zinc finger domain-containing protein [Candidatus Nitrosotenuis sp.]